MKERKRFSIKRTLFSGIMFKIKKRSPYLMKFSMGLILIAACITVYFPAKTVFGDSNKNVQIITLDDAVQAALKKNSQILKLDMSINELKRQRDSLISSKAAIQGMLGNEERIKGEMQAADPATLAQLQAQLMGIQQLLMRMGVYAPVKGEESEYKQITRTFDFGEYEIDTNIANVLNSKEVAQNSVTTGIHTIYNGILGLNDLYELQLKTYDNSKKKYDDICAKYKNGQISDSDKLSAETDMNKAKLNVDITKRKIDNMYITLKGQMGISPSKIIKLTPYNSVQKDASPIDDYLKKALENRSELKDASNNYNLKKKEFDITKKYLNNDSTDWKAAEQAQIEKEFEMKDAINTVTKDIKAGYTDVMKKKKSLESAQLNKENAAQTLNKMKENLKLGYITEAILRDVEIAYMQADIGYSSAKRDYGEALYKLDAASGIGPKYAMDKTGVN